MARRRKQDPISDFISLIVGIPALIAFVIFVQVLVAVAEALSTLGTFISNNQGGVTALVMVVAVLALFAKVGKARDERQTTRPQTPATPAPRHPPTVPDPLFLWFTKPRHDTPSVGTIIGQTGRFSADIDYAAPEFNHRRAIEATVPVSAAAVGGGAFLGGGWWIVGVLVAGAAAAIYVLVLDTHDKLSPLHRRPSEQLKAVSGLDALHVLRGAALVKPEPFKQVAADWETAVLEAHRLVERKDAESKLRASAVVSDMNDIVETADKHIAEMERSLALFERRGQEIAAETRAVLARIETLRLSKNTATAVTLNLTARLDALTLKVADAVTVVSRTTDEIGALPTELPDL